MKTDKEVTPLIDDPSKEPSLKPDLAVSKSVKIDADLQEPPGDCEGGIDQKKYSSAIRRIEEENLSIKKEMALAMLKMGVSRQQVMKILNIRIKK